MPTDQAGSGFQLTVQHAAGAYCGRCIGRDLSRAHSAAGKADSHQKGDQQLQRQMNVP